MVRTQVVPTATTRRGLADARGVLLRDAVALRVQARVFHAFGMERLEGAQADVQRDVGDGGAARRGRRPGFRR